MPSVYNDSIGRCYCEPHRREHCNECCMSFDMPNRMAEQRAGLRRPPTRIEELAERKVLLEESFASVSIQSPEAQAHWESYFGEKQRAELVDVHAELEILKQQGKGLEIYEALCKERDKALTMNAERIAFEKAMKDRGEVSPATAARAGIVRLAKELRSNGPITDDDTWDGPEAQRVYEQFIAEPPSAQRDVSVDPHTCTFCRKVTTHRLQCCSRCKKQAYCTKECQVSHWKAHKKECIPIEELSKEDTKRLPLTWEQLEEFGVAPGKSLEVRFIHQEPHLRLIALCKDRAGICKRVAAYTESRTIPGFTTGKVLVWKNPRFHGFLDGSSGARIEEEDLVNIRIK